MAEENSFFDTLGTIGTAVGFATNPVGASISMVGREIASKKSSQAELESETMPYNDPYSSGFGAMGTSNTVLAFGSQTVYEVENTSTTVANSPGFYRIFGTMFIKSGGTVASASISLDNGVASKEIYGFDANGFAALNDHSVTNYDFTVFLTTGESLIVNSSGVTVQFKGSVRQIADANGDLVNPSGFVPQ